MTTGERMRLRRKEIGISAEQVAEHLGVSPATIYRYEKGDIEKVPGDSLAEIAKILKTTPIYLMGWEEQPTSATTDKNTDWRAAAGAIPMNPQQVAPLLGTVRAGLPMYAEENIEGYIPIRQTDGAKYFWLYVRGDSMNAAGMNDGDQILVREQPEVENGEIAVVMVNGDEATVKQFRQEGNLVILTPRSTNPAHQPQIYDLKKIPVRVAGRVVECRKVY